MCAERGAQGILHSPEPDTARNTLFLFTVRKEPEKDRGIYETIFDKMLEESSNIFSSAGIESLL
jgi:hypothetical protein